MSQLRGEGSLSVEDPKGHLPHEGRIRWDELAGPARIEGRPHPYQAPVSILEFVSTVSGSVSPDVVAQGRQRCVRCPPGRDVQEEIQTGRSGKGPVVGDSEALVLGWLEHEGSPGGEYIVRQHGV